MPKLILIVGKSENMGKIQTRLLEYDAESVTIEEPPYFIPEGCTGIIILNSAYSSRDSIKEIFEMVSVTELPFVIVRDRKWSAMLPALLVKGVLERDLFNENLGTDPFDVRECASSCVVEYHLNNKVIPDQYIRHFLEKIFPDYRLTEEDTLKIRGLSAWAQIPISLEDSDPSDFISKGELIPKKSPEPFNRSLNQLPEIQWAKPPEPPKKLLTVDDVVEICQELRSKL